jgi:hypothetical protein
MGLADGMPRRMRQSRCGIPSKNPGRTKTPKDRTFLHVSLSGISGSSSEFLALQGAKIRSSYIKFAQQERIKMTEKVKSLEQDIQAKEGEIEAARGKCWGRLISRDDGG